MRITRKTKNTLKTILGVVLIIGAVLGISALINSAVNKTDDGLVEISPKFEVGGLTATGKYQETNLSIYNKESFNCNGLQVSLDFESNVQYQAYFYDENDNFVSASDVYVEGQTLNVPLQGLKARIVITPIWDDDVEEDDKEIGFFSVNKYAKQLTIKVDEKQFKNFGEKEKSIVGVYLNPTNNLFSADGVGKLGVSGSFEEDSTSPWTYDTIDTSGYLYLIIKVPTETYDGIVLRNDSQQPALNLFKYVPTASTVYTSASTEIIYQDSNVTYLKFDINTSIEGFGITIDTNAINNFIVCGF